MVLVLRVYALYGCNRNLMAIRFTLAKDLCSVNSSWSHSSSPALTVGYIYIPSRYNILNILVSTVVIHLPQLSGCLLVNTHRVAFVCWFPMILFESTLFILSVIQSMRCALDDTNTPKLMFVFATRFAHLLPGLDGVILVVVLIDCIV